MLFTSLQIVLELFNLVWNHPAETDAHTEKNVDISATNEEKKSIKILYFVLFPFDIVWDRFFVLNTYGIRTYIQKSIYGYQMFSFALDWSTNTRKLAALFQSKVFSLNS